MVEMISRLAKCFKINISKDKRKYLSNYPIIKEVNRTEQGISIQFTNGDITVLDVVGLSYDFNGNFNNNKRNNIKLK